MGFLVDMEQTGQFRCCSKAGINSGVGLIDQPSELMSGLLSLRGMRNNCSVAWCLKTVNWSC